MLTPKQRDMLKLIHKRVQTDGVVPSYEEMREELNLASKSGVYRLVKALEERGFIKHLANKARAIEITNLPEALDPETVSAFCHWRRHVSGWPRTGSSRSRSSGHGSNRGRHSGRSNSTRVPPCFRSRFHGGQLGQALRLGRQGRFDDQCGD